MPPPSHAQDTINLPPDYYGEDLRRGFAAWKNTGWVRTTDDALASDVEYVTDGATPRAFIRKYGEMSLVLASIDTSISTMDTLRRLDIAFDGPLAQYPDPIAREQEGYHKNFHLPWCGPGGATLVPGYRWIMYPNIYPKIDMYLYCGSRGQKIMFVIRPEGDPANLTMSFSGHDDLDIDVLGNLRMLLQERWVVLPEAVAYQYDGNNDIWPVNWTAGYTADTVSGEVGFNFGQYDRYKPLVLLIGPPPMMGGPSVYTAGLCWSTYYGGEEDDFVFDSTIDGPGNYYITGQTWSNVDFPVVAGSVLTEASPAAFAARFNDNDNLLWSSIYGSTTGIQMGLGCARPSNGEELFIGGRIGGSEIPVPLNGQPTGRYIDTDPGSGNRAFIASFQMTDGVLNWSTYFGTAGSSVKSLAFDAFSNLYVAGDALGGLPAPTVLTPPTGQISWENSGDFDGYLAKLDASMRVWWSTYIGGTGSDGINVVRVGANKVVVAGRTQSASFQTWNAGGSNAHNHASSTYSSDVMLLEFALDGVQQWGSFFSYGGATNHPVMALDRNNGDVFLGGIMLAGENDMPVSTDAPWYQSPNSSEKSYIWQIGADHVRKYSTYVTGTGGPNHLRCIEVNNYGQIYAGGISWSTSMPTSCWDGLYCALDPLGAGDAYILSLSPQHQRSWWTFFGGDSDYFNHAEQIRTIAFKGTDRVYISGETMSPYVEQNGVVLQFFPLHDELGGAWWDSHFDPLSGSDSFLTSFCMEGVVALNELAEIRNGMNIFVDATGSFLLSGLNNGQHTARLFDAAGHLVHESRFNADASGGGRIQPGSLCTGIYVMLVDGHARRIHFER